jgi:hypothetical protein
VDAVLPVSVSWQTRSPKAITVDYDELIKSWKAESRKANIILRARAGPAFGPALPTKAPLGAARAVEATTSGVHR